MGHQFGDLPGLKILVLRSGKSLIDVVSVRWCRAAEPMMIVPRAVIKTRFDAIFTASLHEYFPHVGFVAAVRDTVIRLRARPKAVPRHMLGRQHRVLHSRIARELDPGVHVEAVWI